MKIYIYFKVDRGGFYETAYAQWRRREGDFNALLLRTQHTLYSWKREFERCGAEVVVDMRSSFLLPQRLRAYLPLPVAKAVRAVLWGSRLDVWFLQKSILHRVEQFKPDVVFIPLGSGVWSSTLAALRERGYFLVQWCGLPAETMQRRDKRNLPYFDLIFQPANLERGLREAGAAGRIEYVPIGIDPEIHRPVCLSEQEQRQFSSDVCFIGGVSKRFHSARRAMLEYLVEQCPELEIKLWGGYREHVVGSPLMKVWQGQVWGEDQVKALNATKIGLNFHVDHQSGELDRGLNLRAFELAACRVFQLLQRVPSVSEFFEEDKEVVCFDTKEEMVDKIRYYLKNEEARQRIAQAAYERALREHTWQCRVRQMVNVIQQALASRSL